ncbi:MAG: T9SS type A sorting domain-containing protein [Bacteroidales bacterium]|nr:T9SS type A sorting domain-containing protein [Bacteroidales bacterium]
MRKNLLIIIAVGICYYSFGQKATKITNSNLTNMSVLVTEPVGDKEILPTGPVLPSNESTRNRTSGPEIIIGKTKYDIQTNTSMARRLTYLSNGKAAATWTFANSGTPYTDRGAGYNLRISGGTWSPYPVGTPITGMLRIESGPTYWPSFGATNNDGSEIIIAHNSSATFNLLSRATMGTGNWAETPLSTHSVIWARVATGGTAKNTVHALGRIRPAGSKAGGIYDAVLYSRSTDGGANWDKIAVTLPGEDSTKFKKMWSEQYAIDANGDNVAVVMGGMFNSVYLFKSTDNGNNWSNKLIWNFPHAVMNPDSTSYADTVPCFDGSLSVLIDNTGRVHVWGGVTRVNETVAPNWYYYPATCGMIYWNDAMNTITGALDLCPNFCWPFDNYVERNGNGIWDCTYYSNYVKMGYNVGGTSMQSGSIDASGNLFVVFQHMSDADPATFHVYGVDTVPYRHLFCISSTDGGTNWSDAFEITPFDEGREFVYPAVAKNTTDSLRLIYQEDDLPGNSLNPSSANPHPNGYENDIVYLAVPVADLLSVPEKNKPVSNATLYPNPANDYTNISYSLSKPAIINISVINLMGQKVISFNYSGASGINQMKLNTSDIAKGIYIVKIEAEEKVFTQKLVKD